MAKTRMRSKIPELRRALVGRFEEHHALSARMHLDHVDQLDELVGRLDTEVDRLMAPFAEPATRLIIHPRDRQAQRRGHRGRDRHRHEPLPDPAHLASWAGLAPGNYESAGKRTIGRAPRATRRCARRLCESAWVATRSDTYLAAQYRRFRRRFGAKSEPKAIFAVAHTMLGIVWHVLARETTYQDLGPDYLNAEPTPKPASATSSASSKRSATRSPSSPPLDQSLP